VSGEASRPLTAADGAEFRALIEEMPDGVWRASAVVRLETESEEREQPHDVELFSSEQAARSRADRTAMGRGFLSFSLEVKRQPNPR
jgi:hypothetical protein